MKVVVVRNTTGQVVASKSGMAVGVPFWNLVLLLAVCRFGGGAGRPSLMAADKGEGLLEGSGGGGGGGGGEVHLGNSRRVCA